MSRTDQERDMCGPVCQSTNNGLNSWEMTGYVH